MKNLRKVLSFVLVLAMVLGMVTTAFAAASFTDADKITNVEAATVLNAIGVIQGLPDGSFGGAMTLTRDQGATIIARLVLGKDVADKLVAVAAPFSDVPTSHWAAGYISWAAANGIVSGTGNGTFLPGGQLTIVQFAKMCLTALGYKSEYEGFVGDNWSNNVSAAANKAGILEGVAITTDVCTRDVAAQMAFNVLLGTEVKYSGGTSVKVGDTTVTVDATRSDVTTGIFCENNTKLTKSAVGAAGADAFGRPAHTWTNDTKKVGTFADKAKLTYTAEVALGTIYTDLGLTAKTTVSAVRNGVDITITGGALTKGDTTIKVGGNGVLTEIYKDATTGGYKIVMIDTFVGVVTSVTAATSTADRYITVANRTLGYTLADGKYETEAFAQKDIVAYTVGQEDGAAKIQSVAKLEKAATAKVTKLVGATSFDAEATYKYAAKANAKPVEVNGTYDIYCDQYGYALYMEKVAGTTNYAVLVGVGNVNTGYGDATKRTATLLFADGSTAKADIKAKDATAAGILYETNTASKEAILVTYTLGDDGVYTVNPTNVSGDAFTVTNGKSEFTFDGAKKYANDSTLFFVATEGTTDGFAHFAVYTGYKNVPSIVESKSVFATLIEDKGIVKVVYVAATAVEGTSGSELVLLKSAAETETTVTTGNSSYAYYEVTAAEGTKLVSSTVYTQLAKGFNRISNYTVDKNNVITGITFAGDPNFQATGTVASNGEVVGFKSTAWNEYGEVIAAEYYAFADDAVVYVASADDKTLTVGDINAVETDKNDIALVVLDSTNKIVKKVFVQKVNDTAVVTYTQTNITGNFTESALAAGTVAVVKTGATPSDTTATELGLNTAFEYVLVNVVVPSTGKLSIKWVEAGSWNPSQQACMKNGREWTSADGLIAGAAETIICNIGGDVNIAAGTYHYQVLDAANGNIIQQGVVVY